MPDVQMPVEYRNDVLPEIISLLRSGECCSIVGIAGAGKGNLARHLMRADVRLHYLGADAATTVFLLLACKPLAQRPLATFYLEALDQLGDALTELGGPFPALAPEINRLFQEAQSNADFLGRRNLEKALTRVLSSGAQQVIFILDDCDELFAKVPSVFFADLRELRDNHKYKVVYMTLTRRELQFLRADYSEEEELMDLLPASHLVAVPPHSQADSTALLKRLAARQNPPVLLTPLEIQQLYEWGGGHAALMRALFFATRHKIPAHLPDAFMRLAHDPEIEAECDKIWDGLEEEERAYLEQLVHGATPSAAALARLERRGLIRVHPTRPAEFASPVFEMFVGGLQGMSGGYGATIVIDFAGAPSPVIVNGQTLTNLNMADYELLRLLWEKRPGICSNNDLIQGIRLAEAKDPSIRAPGSPLQRLDFYMRELKAKLGPTGQAIRSESNGYCLAG